ncbi:MAG: hypothetical protein JO026_02905, partial [Patescibacteria group bacterium]|nr:hypothetical protein [Patescibacteria group bacterium]
IFVGIHAFNHDQPLLLITVSGYDFAFQGMLTWEPTLSTSLGDFYAPAGAPSSPNAPVLTFTDAVTDNIDVRKSNAEWPIIWGFPRQDLLIITTNESTLREVMTRLSLQTSAAQ